MQHTPLIRDLADRLRRRNIDSVVYFHTDHFEPWRPIGATPAVSAAVVDSLHDFLRATERIDFARRLTLFYKPHLNYTLSRDREMLRADPDDLVGFLPQGQLEEQFGRAAMRPFADESRHEIQLHIHHEYYTATRAHTDAAAIEWFASSAGRALDEQRLDLAIRLNREIIARETGRKPENWFFIHGQWALNGSDDRACTISNEIVILQRHGCRGDFTFPAGRVAVNPRIKVPYLCRALDACKGYDRPEAAPEIALGNRAAAAAGKFFIWASAANSQQCSLDYMSEASRRHIANTEEAANALIDGSYAAGRQLFIKTHAHSMHAYYFEHARSPIFPHQHPAAQRLLSVIFDAAMLAGLDVQFLTAGEIYDRVLDMPPDPAGDIDLVTSYMRRTKPLRGGDAGSSLPPPGLQIAAGSKSVASKVELVRETVGHVLRRRIDELGIRGSGAYQHYSNMLEMGLPLPNYELAALDIVQREVPPLTAYHEIGSGIGTLAFLLALNGFPAFGIERDHRRHNTAAAIWRELVLRTGIPTAKCRLICGTFPGAAARLDTAHAIAILTDFITTQTPEQFAAILTGLQRYRYVLLDLRRFCIRRETNEAQQTLLDELRAWGFVPRLQVSDPSGSDYTFALLRNQSPSQSGRVKAILSRLGAAWPAPWRRPRRRMITTAPGDDAGDSLPPA